MFAVVELPDFSLQALLRQEPELHRQPVALIDESASKAVILQLTEAARAAGICEGMTSTQALARCRTVRVRGRSILQETSAHEALAQWAYSVTPYFEVTAPGVMTFDCRGLEIRSSEQFGRGLIRQLEQLHFQSRLGMAQTPLLARHAARCATPLLIIEDPHDFLNQLPLEALEPSEAAWNILKKWGLRTVGDLTRLDPAEVVSRLGVAARELFQRASPTANRPLRFATAPETFEEAMEWENPVETLEPLLFVLRRFLEQIAFRLELRGWVAEELQLRLFLSSGDVEREASGVSASADPSRLKAGFPTALLSSMPNTAQYTRTFKIPSPTCQIETLFRMLHTHLENVRTEHPIAGAALSAKPGRPVQQQFGLFEMVLRDPNRFSETLAQLTGLVGNGQVGVPSRPDSHHPDAFRLEPVAFDSPAPGRSHSPAPPVIGPVLRRFRPPLSLQVELKEERPIFLKSSLDQGAIRRTSGPWRSSGHWWEDCRWEREEWDVQLRSGALYRMFYDGRNWFLEGVYD